MADGTRRGTTNVNVPAANPEKAVRLSRLGRELRLTDQILSTDLDTVSIVADGPAPAWTTLDGDHVSFSMKHMPNPVTRVDLAVWLGTNAHELGHVLFSPRSGSPLMGRVIEADRTFMRGIADLHNIVEDQRQERLILGKFAPWRSYLTAALGHHLAGDTEFSWLLMTGRTWLPDPVRAQARALFVEAQGEWMATEVTRLVGEYQRLTDPGDTEDDEAWAILDRLHDIFGTSLPSLPHRCQVMQGGTPDTGQPGEGAPAPADEAGEPGDGDPGEGEGDDAEGDAADGEDESGASSPGKDTGPAQAPKPQKSLKDQLRDAAQTQVNEEADAAEDLDSILDALRWGRPDDQASGEDPVGRFEPASDEAKRLHHEVGDALLDLKDAAEPGWVKRVESGRLNPGRWARMIGGDSVLDIGDELFDRYDPGQMDSTELELVLLVDVSGSMGNHTQALGESVWAIRQAVDDLEGDATVLTWDSGPHRVLASAGDRPDGRVFVPASMGGTNPTALGEAYRLLAGSQARNRLMVILTDGDWYGNAERVIEAMNGAGVTTVLAHYPTGWQKDAELDLHGCRYGRSITALPELALLFRDVATAQIGAWR